jgi:hypothetical protein
VVCCRHELGQGWVAEDGVVGQRDVGDVQVKAFCPVVVPSVEGDGQANLSDGRVEPSVTPKNGRVGMSR